jgi:hypothetical protein
MLWWTCIVGLINCSYLFVGKYFWVKTELIILIYGILRLFIWNLTIIAAECFTLSDELLTVFCFHNWEIRIGWWLKVDGGKDWWNRSNNTPCALRGVEFTVPAFITEVPYALKVEDFVISSELLYCVIRYIILKFQRILVHSSYKVSGSISSTVSLCRMWRSCVLSSTPDSLKSHTLKITVHWGATLCELEEIYHHCVETSFLHL